MNIYFIVGFLLSIKLPSRNFNPWTRFDGKNFRLDFQLFHTCWASFELIIFTSANSQRDVLQRKKIHSNQISFHHPLFIQSDGSMSSSLASYNTKNKQAKPHTKRRRVLCCCTTRKPETQQDLERYGISTSNSIDLVGLEQLWQVHVSSFSTQWCDRIRFCYLLQESEIESSKTKTSKGCHLHAK